MTAKPITGSAVCFKSVSRHFGTVRAVDDVNLDVADGEFFAMLGPSGSGKTTCLRLMAGFEQPNSGTIELFGQDVTQVPPFSRDVNTVFQDYALFPHMTVGDNIAYGLMVKGIAKATREQRVKEMLDVVQLGGMQGRKPSQLSGGQRQRVALARALINEPSVLLLDEPLGALDLKLRQQMQLELKTIQHRFGITFVFVTHDQEEAMTMSDRIAVFNQGKIEQIGTPADIYQNPRTEFVATFVGTSNIFKGERAVKFGGKEGVFALRPEKIRILHSDESIPPGRQLIGGTIREIFYLGMSTRYIVDLDEGGELIIQEHNTRQDISAERGKPVVMVWKRDDLRALNG